MRRRILDWMQLGKIFWRDVYEEGDSKKKVNALSWEVYVKYKEELISY